MFFRNPDLNVNRSWILYTMLKKNTRTARITRSHGTAFEPRLCVPKRRGAGSAPTTPYPPSLSPHHLASYHRPPSRTILVLTWMVHPQTLRNYLPHPCSFSASLFPPLLLLLPLPRLLFSLHLSFIFFFFSPVIRHIFYPCLLLIRTILPFFIFRRPFIFFSFKFSFKVSWSFDSLCFSFHVSSTLSCFALFTPFTLCLLISAFLFLFPYWCC